MDVSNREKQALENQTKEPGALDGEELIETLVSLTGLPESLAHQELDQILKMSGYTPGTKTQLTLEELRSALLVYLEALQASSAD